MRITFMIFLLFVLAIGNAGGCGTTSEDPPIVTPVDPPDPGPGDPDNPPDTDNPPDGDEPIGVDEVLELSDGFGLIGQPGTDLKLLDPSVGNEILLLTGRDAQFFKELSSVVECPLCLTGFSSYTQFVNATFWYQNTIGTTPINDYNDALYTGRDLDRLHNAIYLMSWVLDQRMDELMSCAVEKAVLEIPDKYKLPFSLVPQIDNSKLMDDLNLFFFAAFPNTTHIAVGAFNNQRRADGAITLGNTWSEILDSRPQGQRNLDKLNTLDSVLIGFNTNINADAFDINGGTNSTDPIPLSRTAGTVFHEILHNFGFGHVSNDPQSYIDRSLAIFALEDCMCNIVRNRVLAGNLQELAALGTQSPLPDDSNLPREIQCRDQRLNASTYYMIKPKVRNVALDANGGEGGPYFNRQPNPNNDNHLWELKKYGGYYMIKPKVRNVALDANGGEGGPYFHPEPSANNDNHLWELKKYGGYYMIKPKVRNVALDANGGEGGPYFNRQPNPNNDNHLWELVLY